PSSIADRPECVSDRHGSTSTGIPNSACSWPRSLPADRPVESRAARQSAAAVRRRSTGPFRQSALESRHGVPALANRYATAPCARQEWTRDHRLVVSRFRFLRVPLRQGTRRLQNERLPLSSLE